MMPTHPVIFSLESSVWSPATCSTEVCREPRFSIHSAASGDSPAKGKDDLVITPEGPRPRKDVHHVRPGETVRRNDDGTYTVIPSGEPGSSQPKGKKQNEN